MDIKVKQILGLCWQGNDLLNSLYLVRYFYHAIKKWLALSPHNKKGWVQIQVGAYPCGVLVLGLPPTV